MLQRHATVVCHNGTSKLCACESSQAPNTEEGDRKEQRKEKKKKTCCWQRDILPLREQI